MCLLASNSAMSSSIQSLIVLLRIVVQSSPARSELTRKIERPAVSAVALTSNPFERVAKTGGCGRHLERIETVDFHVAPDVSVIICGETVLSVCVAIGSAGRLRFKPRDQRRQRQRIGLCRLFPFRIVDHVSLLLSPCWRSLICHDRSSARLC